MNNIINELKKIILQEWISDKDNFKRTIIYYYALFIPVIYIYIGHRNFFLKLTDYPGDLKDWYSNSYQHFFAFIVFFIIPVLIIKIVFKENLKDYGIKTGNIKDGIKLSVFILAILLPLLYSGVNSPDFLQEYPLVKGAFFSVKLIILWELIYLVYYIAWEFFFRGFLLFGLSKNGSIFNALVIQTVISTLLHIGKPFGETFSAIFGGIIFGILALRTGSIFYPLIVHFIIGISTDLLCAHFGGILL